MMEQPTTQNACRGYLLVGRLTSVIAGKTLGIDTAPLIYYIEEHPQSTQVTNDLFNNLQMNKLACLYIIRYTALRGARCRTTRNHRKSP